MLEVEITARAGTFDVAAGFRVTPGEILAIIGPNGAGKSTVLRCIAGLHPLVSGRIALGGVTLEDASVRLPPEERRVGMMFQDGLLFPHLSVLENVTFGLRATGRSASEAREVALERLRALGAIELAMRRPGSLSGGEQQRVALARALSTDPDVVLLDEPLSAVDVEARNLLRPDLRSTLSGLSVPAVVVSHDPLDAAVIADRAVVMEGGSITQEGTLGEIARHPRSAWAAALVGTNLLPGLGRGHSVEIGDITLQVADPVSGAVFARIDPSAIALHLSRPEGSARNSMEARVRSLEPAGSRVRVGLEGPLDLTAEITPQSVADLGLAEGTGVWFSVKATEISTYPR